MLWRCCASFEQGIARLGTNDLQVRRYSAMELGDSTPRVLTSSKFLPTQGIFAAACDSRRFVAEYRHSVLRPVLGGRGGKEQMATLDEIGQEKQRIQQAARGGICLSILSARERLKSFCSSAASTRSKKTGRLSGGPPFIRNGDFQFGAGPKCCIV
jgi:hypothetical protein